MLPQMRKQLIDLAIQHARNNISQLKVYMEMGQERARKLAESMGKEKLVLKQINERTAKLKAEIAEIHRQMKGYDLEVHNILF